MIVGGGALTKPGTRRVADTVPGSGPLGGIHAALTSVAVDCACPVLIVACDMPYITTALVTRLFDELQDADIVVTQTDRGYHPLCAVYTRACVDPIARR